MPITKQLDPGIRDPQVKELQQWLNANGFIIAQTGPGSPGQETDYFGPLTQAAVKRLQENWGLDSVGRVGPKTLQLIGNYPMTKPGFPASQEPIPRQVSPAVTEPKTREEQITDVQREIGGLETTVQEAQSLGYEPQQEIRTNLQGELLPPSITGSDLLDETLRTLQASLDEIKKRGEIINPYVEITKEKAAEFLNQAQKDVEPYYASQLKLAKDNLLRSIGYGIQDVEAFEQNLERQYGKGLRQIGATAAETGFVYSGLRGQQERELAEETQRQIDENRRKLEFGAYGLGSEFAQQWGRPGLEESYIREAPRAFAGTESFERPTQNRMLYTLSPDVYEGLIGEKQKEKELGTRALASDYETQFKEEELVKRTRQLEL